MIIQSPELLVYKKKDALRRIGEHFVALAVFEDGLIFGSKFSERQSRPGQWLMQIGPTSIIGGIGDLSDFKSAMFALNNFCQHISNMVNERCLTGAGIVKFMSNFLRQAFEEGANALAVNFIVADCQTEEDTNKPDLWFIDFEGSVKQLRNFAVAGGSEHEKPLTEEELKALSPVEKSYLEFQKKDFMNAGMPDEAYSPIRIYQPKKRAIAYLEKNWRQNMKKDEAVELVKQTLFKHNPESREKAIEIIVVEYDGKTEILYFKK